MQRATSVPDSVNAEIEHWKYGKRWLLCAGQPELLFTENETDFAKLFNGKNRSPYVKDAFHEYLIRGNKSGVNPQQTGTKMAAYYPLQLRPGQSETIKLRLTDMEPLATMERGLGLVGTITSPGHADPTAGVPAANDFGAGFDGVFSLRQKEADEFYASRVTSELSEDAKSVMRQAFGGLLWSKQFYHYDIRNWLDGDPAGPPPPPERLKGRNKDWTHLYNDDVISMPDKWEYPWYAAWDLSFPLHFARARRSRFREGAADPSSPRMVYASQRTTACLRMGFWRRESSGARLGRVARLQDRTAGARCGRSWVP